MIHAPETPVITAGEREGILALDERSISRWGQTIKTVSFASSDPRIDHAVAHFGPDDGARLASNLVVEADVIAGRSGPGVTAGDRIRARFVPFSEAGGEGSRYQVWTPCRDLAPTNELVNGRGIGSPTAESLEAINDDNTERSARILKSDGTQELWLGVQLEAPILFSRFVVHNGTGRSVRGQGYVYAGWFDTSHGKPRIEVQSQPQGPWHTIALIDDYPETTAAQRPKFTPDQPYVVILKEPITAVAVRVIGRASHNGVETHDELALGEIEGYGLRK